MAATDDLMVWWSGFDRIDGRFGLVLVSNLRKEQHGSFPGESGQVRSQQEIDQGMIEV